MYTVVSRNSYFLLPDLTGFSCGVCIKPHTPIAALQLLLEAQYTINGKQEPMIDLVDVLAGTSPGS